MQNNPEFYATDQDTLITLAVIAWVIYFARVAYDRKKTPKPPFGTRTRKGNPPE